ncbi:hypothetical protein RN001_010661 [Aquatica leii]|uniref:CRAL-TRIO domain-containing protein n=1 Tax=Aquatica leii TaxID=1421715 RepID=A0AAN7P1B0_9COLE|nr:hypothetical protein RN001_010661 [Aquatica leii]
MSRLSILEYTEDDVKKIWAKHEKTKNDVKQDVDIISKWLKTQPHLPEAPDERIIERFLLLNKFRLEVTKQKIDMYYTVRSMIPEFYDRNPNEKVMRKVLDVVPFIPLPKLTKDLNRVVVIKALDVDVDNFDPGAYIAHTLNVAEVRLREDYYHKELQIYDLLGLKLGHLTKFTPSLIRKGSFVIEKVFANISAGIHFVNAPNFVDPFLALLKNTLKPKLAEKVFVHKTFDSLSKIISKDVLPKDYGGNEKSLKELLEEWKQVFLEFDDLFEHLRQVKVDEKLRVEPITFANDLFGVEGSFKQLHID